MTELARICQARGRSVSPTLTARNDVRILEAGERVPASSHAGRVIAGEPGAVTDRIQELAACGVEHLVLELLTADGRELEEQMATFAEHVRPAFA